MRHKQRPIKIENPPQHSTSTTYQSFNEEYYDDGDVEQQQQQYNHHLQQHNDDYHDLVEGGGAGTNGQDDDGAEYVDEDVDDIVEDDDIDDAQGGVHLDPSVVVAPSGHLEDPYSDDVDVDDPLYVPETNSVPNNQIHMSDVMRLAFLENNDITIDEHYDFNKMSTAQILRRKLQNIAQEQYCQQTPQQVKYNNLPEQFCQPQQQQHPQQQKQHHHHQQQQQQQVKYQPELYCQQTPQQLKYSNQPEQYCSQPQQQKIKHNNQPQQSQQTKPQTQKIQHTKPQQQKNHQPTQPQQSQQTIHQLNINNEEEEEEEEDEDDEDDNYTPHPQRQASRVQEPRDSVDASSFNGTSFFCDEPDCGKSFPSLRKLRHHKVVHSDEFPYVCEFPGCTKKFKRKFGIDLHSTTHFELVPEMFARTSNNSSLRFFGRRMQYSMCKPCGEKFKTVHEYQYHMLKHGKEPFKCPVKGCGQTFGIWKSFQKHRASHYFNYFCKMDPTCDHQTSNLQLLKLHIYCCHFKRKLPTDMYATCASDVGAL